jgi:hypothetical protein
VLIVERLPNEHYPPLCQQRQKQIHSDEQA